MVQGNGRHTKGNIEPKQTRPAKDFDLVQAHNEMGSTYFATSF